MIKDSIIYMTYMGNSLKKCVSFIGFLLLFTSFSYAQKTTAYKEVSGKVTHLNMPVPDVNISIESSNKGTNTDQNGNYSMSVAVGDVLRFSHVSFKSIRIVIEDITVTLNIELSNYINELDEVVINTKNTSDKKVNSVDPYSQKINTAIGEINPMILPSTVFYLSGKEIGNQYSSLTEALEKRLGRQMPTIFDIDGIVYYNDDSTVALDRILDVYVIMGSAGTMRWGGPVIIVRTMDNPDVIKEKREAIAEQHRNQNYYAEDAVATTSTANPKTKTIPFRSNNVRNITGTITYLGAPVPDVNIKVKNSSRGTKTDVNGYYSLEIKNGEIVQFSHLSFKSLNVVIEDVTAILDIEMVEKTNTLDEVVVIAKNVEGAILKRSKEANKKFETSRGSFNPETAGFAVSYVDGDELSNTYANLREALVGKISGFKIRNNKGYLRGDNFSVTQDYPVGWEIDGVFTTEEPTWLDLSNVKSVYALKSLAATNKYGTLGAGGIIVIKTKSGDLSSNTRQNATASEYQNKNYYANDASTVNLSSLSSNPYTEQIEALNDLQKAYRFYENEVIDKVNNYDIHLSIAKAFSRTYDSPNLAAQILIGITSEYRDNPEVLKAIAYNLQSIGAYPEAVKTYQEIFTLRPKYAQSYRDLANAYIENSQFKKGWRLYMSYLMQGHDVSGEGIGQVIFNEMEYLYFNRSNQTDINENFLPKSESIDEFRNDVRLVFEWNTSEAEFDLEFVGPDKRAYVFEHDLIANQELITDEKLKGYSCKEFFIDDVGNGEWLVNFSYKGNKKPEPTYLKVTTYYFWGKSSQKKQIEIYKFQEEREKFQLIRINQQKLLTSK